VATPYRPLSTPASALCTRRGHRDDQANAERQAQRDEDGLVQAAGSSRRK
jgi:hypothetical protein